MPHDILTVEDHNRDGLTITDYTTWSHGRCVQFTINDAQAAIFKPDKVREIRDTLTKWLETVELDNR